MSLRSLILCTLLVIVGCASAEDDADEAPRDASATPKETLAFVTPSTTSLLPNDELLLSVKYLNDAGVPQPGVMVDFSLVGAAAGASLSPTKVVTGDDGVAKTTLRAGSTASDLQVRARAGEDAFAYLPLSVRPALGTRLSVAVHYEGERAIAAYTITSVPMTCAQALSSGLAGEFVYHFNAPDDQATFELGYGLSTALVAWGSDETGSKLARGCKEFTAPVTEDAAEAQTLVTLELSDVDLRLKSPLALELEINATTAVRRFTEVSGRAVASIVMPNTAYSMFADADYLLDAVQSTLTARGNASGASALAARRSALSLAASLQPALVAQQAGPTAYGKAIGEELARRGASLVLRWVLGSVELSGLFAQSANGSQTLAFASLPPTSIVTRFAPESAELSVEPLRVELGLGNYGRTLFAGVNAEDRALRAGCASVFASWWTKSALIDLLPAADAQAVCIASLAALDSAIDGQLAPLDVSATLQLAGAVPVHDRSEDGAVDDLGPGEITGTWGEDAIQASLRTPQRTAFQ